MTPKKLPKIELYLTQIKSVYVKSDLDRKKEIENSLENLVNKLEKQESIFEFDEEKEKTRTGKYKLDRKN